jgi:hypothetical protein
MASPETGTDKSSERIEYSLDIATEICELVASGLALKEVCLLNGMPGRTTAYKWLNEHAEFANMYARAREERAELVADEVIMIADTEADANKARVRIDARKWWAAKVAPKKYGERISTEVTGKDGGPIETANVELTETERARRVAFILTHAAKANGHDKTA